MTNKEAIEYIKTDISRLWDTPQNLEHKEALEKAIKALEQEPCADAISRQAVLNVMRKNHRIGGKDIDGDYIEGDYRESLYDDVMSLSSVNLAD